MRQVYRTREAPREDSCGILSWWEQRDPGFLCGGRGQQKPRLVPLMSCNHALLAIVCPRLLTFTPARDEPVAASWLHMSWGGSANGSTWGSHRQEWANKIRGFSERKACSRGVLFHHGSLLPTVDATSGYTSRLLSAEGLWKSGDFKGLSCQGHLWGKDVGKGLHG